MELQSAPDRETWCPVLRFIKEYWSTQFLTFRAVLPSESEFSVS